jgi:hypothetical protein
MVDTVWFTLILYTRCAVTSEAYHQLVSSPEQLLSRSHRNDLFRALEKSGVPASEFRLHVDPAKYPGWLFIYHDPSQSYFMIRALTYTFKIAGILGNGDPAVQDFTKTRRFHGIVYSAIGSKFKSMQKVEDLNLTWEEVVPLVGKWALAAVEGFREYNETPDLWAEFERGRQLFSAPSENTLFTEAERELISVQIQQIKVFITNTYELSSDQLLEVNKRLDELAEASGRLGRKDWLMAFTGAVFSLVLSDLIPPQAAQHILMLALHGLGHLFGLGGPPWPLP